MRDNVTVSGHYMNIEAQVKVPPHPSLMSTTRIVNNSIPHLLSQAGGLPRLEGGVPDAAGEQAAGDVGGQPGR